MKTLIMLVLLATLCAAQIVPPQPNYSQYGSYSRQLRVYEATQRRIDRINLRRYRHFRKEVRYKQTSRIVVRRNNYRYGDAMQSWRDRRRYYRQRNN